MNSMEDLLGMIATESLTSEAPLQRGIARQGYINTNYHFLPSSSNSDVHSLNYNLRLVKQDDGRLVWED